MVSDEILIDQSLLSAVIHAFSPLLHAEVEAKAILEEVINAEEEEEKLLFTGQKVELINTVCCSPKFRKLLMSEKSHMHQVISVLSRPPLLNLLTFKQLRLMSKRCIIEKWEEGQQFKPDGSGIWVVAAGNFSLPSRNVKFDTEIFRLSSFAQERTVSEGGIIGDFECMTGVKTKRRVKVLAKAITVFIPRQAWLAILTSNTSKGRPLSIELCKVLSKGISLSESEEVQTISFLTSPSRLTTPSAPNSNGQHPPFLQRKGPELTVTDHSDSETDDEEHGNDTTDEKDDADQKGDHKARNPRRNMVVKSLIACIFERFQEISADTPCNDPAYEGADLRDLILAFHGWWGVVGVREFKPTDRGFDELSGSDLIKIVRSGLTVIEVSRWAPSVMQRKDGVSSLTQILNNRIVGSFLPTVPRRSLSRISKGVDHTSERSEVSFLTKSC